MNMIEALDIDINARYMISIVGAGGKTSLLYKLSEKLKRNKKRILISTTTHIYIPHKDIYNDLFINDDNNALLKYAESIKNEGTYVIGHGITNENKMKGIDISFADELYDLNIFDYILIEADGSRRKPIKAPAQWEPMVPKSTAIIIGVIGLDSLGEIADENTVHRLNEFCSVCECHPGDRIDIAKLAKLIIHPQGLFKGAPVNAKKIVLLNKADDDSLREAGSEIKGMVSDDNIRFVTASLKNETYWM